MKKTIPMKIKLVVINWERVGKSPTFHKLGWVGGGVNKLKYLVLFRKIGSPYN